MELDLAMCLPLVLPILLPSWLSKWGITRRKHTHWSQKTGLRCVYRGRTFSEFYTVKLTRESLGTQRNKKSPELGLLPCSLSPFPLQIASCLASVVWFTWWFELQGRFLRPGLPLKWRCWRSGWDKMTSDLSSSPGTLWLLGTGGGRRGPQMTFTLLKISQAPHDLKSIYSVLLNVGYSLNTCQDSLAPSLYIWLRGWWAYLS